MAEEKNKQWEKDYPLAKLIMEGLKGIKGEDKKKQEETPISYEEWQLRKRRESGFMY
jgi:hypothetical protein